MVQLCFSCLIAFCLLKNLNPHKLHGYDLSRGDRVWIFSCLLTFFRDEKLLPQKLQNNAWAFGVGFISWGFNSSEFSCWFFILRSITWSSILSFDWFSVLSVSFSVNLSRWILDERSRISSAGFSYWTLIFFETGVISWSSKSFWSSFSAPKSITRSSLSDRFSISDSSLSKSFSELSLLLGFATKDCSVCSWLLTATELLHGSRTSSKPTAWCASEWDVVLFVVSSG